MFFFLLLEKVGDQNIGEEVIKLRGFVFESFYFFSEEECKFFQKGVRWVEKGKREEYCRLELFFF